LRMMLIIKERMRWTKIFIIEDKLINKANYIVHTLRDRKNLHVDNTQNNLIEQF